MVTTPIMTMMLILVTRTIQLLITIVIITRPMIAKAITIIRTITSLIKGKKAREADLVSVLTRA